MYHWVGDKKRWFAWFSGCPHVCGGAAFLGDELEYHSQEVHVNTTTQCCVCNRPSLACSLHLKNN